MDIHTFIGNYREAFGQQAELPIVFWYSDQPEAPAEKVNGCFFKSMAQVRNGKIISLNAETIGCGGGKFYTGFTDMPEHVPGFVSLKEKYKKTPDMVVDFIQELQVPKAEKAYLHFARIDKIGSFDKAEGILFLATETRQTNLFGILRPVCPSSFRGRVIKLHHSDVPVQGDVSHHARKLPVRHPRLEQTQGKDTGQAERDKAFQPFKCIF